VNKERFCNSKAFLFLFLVFLRKEWKTEQKKFFLFFCLSFQRKECVVLNNEAQCYLKTCLLIYIRATIVQEILSCCSTFASSMDFVRVFLVTLSTGIYYTVNVRVELSLEYLLICQGISEQSVELFHAKEIFLTMNLVPFVDANISYRGRKSHSRNLLGSTFLSEFVFLIDVYFLVKRE